MIATDISLFPRIAVHTISSLVLGAGPSVWLSKLIQNVACYFTSKFFVICIVISLIFKTFLFYIYSSVLIMLD
jgi:hypothetical protein